MADQLIFKYGLKWDPWLSPLEIEFQMIQHGGVIERKGRKYGEGLFQHYRNAQTIRWPEEDHHRWSDLILKTILEERLTVTQGSRDSSKTRTYVKWALIDYWCFPHNTLFLISSTDVRGLELRVWGDIKDLWDRNRDKFDWLQGNPVDSKHGIFTDALDETGDIRDMRKGIICFVPETWVDTPTGKIQIKNAKPGTEVLNACGSGRIKAVGVSYAPKIVRVSLSNGEFLDCTPEHPFFTQCGWIKAIDLKKYDKVFSAYETMSILSETTWTRLPESEILFAILPYLQTQDIVQTMPQDVSSVAQEIKDGSGVILQYRLCFALGFPERKTGEAGQQAVREMQSANADGSPQSRFLLTCLPRSPNVRQLLSMSSGFSFASTFQNKAENALLRSILQAEIHESKNCPLFFAGNETRTPVGSGISTSGVGPESLHREKTEAERQASLHHGLGLPCDTPECGSGRGDSQHHRQAATRLETNERTKQTWVESVKVLESAGDARYEPSKGGYRVYNLEVEGHPSYSVNGIIVHNCVPVLDSEGNETKLLEKFVGVKQKRRRVICDEAQFLPARYLSILANVDKGDFKSGFTGNPLGQKALDRVAEPECGWANFPEPTKTATWRNKFDGVTINLVGTDSPNFDIGRPKDYDYLINADDARRVEKRFGKDSIEFYSQIMGVRKSGLNPRIVLTPEMCKVNGAYDQCLWGHEDLTNVLGIDAGYGGDACETIFIQFGQSAVGNPVVKFHEPEIIPINLNDPSTPEDQIANGAKKMCQRLNVPFSNVYFEAGMRATLAISLARILGNEVNAVNAGGPATERPVSSDLFVDDETRFGAKRLKRCDEHYSKFITEMWFMVRLLVECKQARELPASVVKEFSEREWIWARGTKYELETKEDFKLRCHYSPNKADATAIALEGARRLGFDIARIPVRDAEKEHDNWLEKEMAAHRKLASKGELKYT